MQNEMVDQVAKAIAKAAAPMLTAMLRDMAAGVSSSVDVSPIALAAIIAMRKPTEAMVHEGGRIVAGLSTGRAIKPYEEDFTEAWVAAIDAALLP